MRPDRSNYLKLIFEYKFLNEQLYGLFTPLMSKILTIKSLEVTTNDTTLL